MMLGQLMRKASERKQRLKGERRDYLRYLTQIRRKVRARRGRSAEGAGVAPPRRPSALWSLAGTTRLWERRPQDEDFGEVRVAVGEQKLGPAADAPSTNPVEDLEPLTRARPAQLHPRVLHGARAAHRHLPAGLGPGAVPGRRGADTFRRPGDHRPAGDLPRARRRVDRGVRVGRAARGLGVGEVAAAQPPPAGERRRAARPGCRLGPQRAGGPARRRVHGAALVRPGRRDPGATSRSP